MQKHIMHDVKIKLGDLHKLPGVGSTTEANALDHVLENPEDFGVEVPERDYISDDVEMEEFIAKQKEEYLKLKDMQQSEEDIEKSIKNVIGYKIDKEVFNVDATYDRIVDEAEKAKEELEELSKHDKVEKLIKTGATNDRITDLTGAEAFFIENVRRGLEIDEGLEDKAYYYDAETDTALHTKVSYAADHPSLKRITKEEYESFVAKKVEEKPPKQYFIDTAIEVGLSHDLTDGIQVAIQAINKYLEEHSPYGEKENKEMMLEAIAYPQFKFDIMKAEDAIVADILEQAKNLSIKNLDKDAIDDKVTDLTLNKLDEYKPRKLDDFNFEVFGQEIDDLTSDIVQKLYSSQEEEPEDLFASML